MTWEIFITMAMPIILILLSKVIKTEYKRIIKFMLMPTKNLVSKAEEIERKNVKPDK